MDDQTKEAKVRGTKQCPRYKSERPSQSDCEGLSHLRNHSAACTTPLEPDVLEHKYYAEGLGLVLTIDKEAGGREELLSVTEIPLSGAPRQAGSARAGLLNEQLGSRRPRGGGNSAVTFPGCYVGRTPEAPRGDCRVRVARPV